MGRTPGPALAIPAKALGVAASPGAYGDGAENRTGVGGSHALWVMGSGAGVSSNVRAKKALTAVHSG